MKSETLAIVVAVIVGILCLSAGYLAGVSNSHASPTTTTAYVPTTQTVTNKEAFIMNVNGSFYWADDVSKDTVIGNPGYSYFLNGSVTFDGVKFSTICPPTYQDCPGSSSSSTLVMIGLIMFNMTFPDKSTVTTSQFMGDGIYIPIIPQHQPRAGMLVEYVGDYPSSTTAYGVWLLVSACNQSPFFCQ
ncbi:MAG TPA: hypothetical protein VEC08_03255 [Nitrososphaerales archaeon]|nr:hypothetical protein [Nitrososphaerales archaeon]